MPNRKNIKVVVFVTGDETYGQQRSLIVDYERAKDYGIDFHYVCLLKGQLYKKLLDLGADIKVIGGRIPEVYPANLIKLFVIFLSHLKPGFEIFSKLRGYLRETQPDLLYTHEVSQYVIGGLAAKSCGIKAVGHFRVMYNTRRNLGLSRVLLSIALNCSLDMGLSVSNAARDSLWGPVKKKTYPVYNGRDIQNIYKTAQTIAAKEECPAPDLIYIGRLTDIKKQDVLIEALGILACEGLRVKTFFVSGENDNSNPYYVKIQDQISRLGLKDDITFTGFVPQPYGMLAKAKVSVLCCWREGCPNLVYESMACQTPIVVPDAGGAGELVEDGVTGLKFTPDDPASLAKCLRRLLEEEELRKQLAKKGLAWASKNFTVDVHMTQLRQRFEQVIEN